MCLCLFVLGVIVLDYLPEGSGRNRWYVRLKVIFKMLLLLGSSRTCTMLLVHGGSSTADVLLCFADDPLEGCLFLISVAGKLHQDGIH